MKEEALAMIADLGDPAQKLNVLREYVQFEALRSFHESEAFSHLAFVGGTALRFLFNLPRFSEDLDFSLEKKAGYEPELWLKKLKNDLSLAGFNVSLKWNSRSTVHKAWVKIDQILKEAGLAAMESQNLSIKLEIDTNPPSGAQCERTLVTKFAMLSLQHHDLSSLMAGKIAALITRKYAKGRDWYDLLWYRGKRPPIAPNLQLLQNALDQTQGRGTFDAAEWREILLQRLDELDCLALVTDIQPFLEKPGDAALMTVAAFRQVLRVDG